MVPQRAVIIGGKILYMLPPHVPWLPVHRLAIAGHHPPRSLAIPDRAVVASGALFVIQAGVVVALLASGGDSRSMLAALAVLYGSALLAAVELRRQLPGLSRWRLLECLACPPNALNVLRHHTLRQAPAALADIIGTSQSVSERMKMVNAVAGLQALLQGVGPRGAESRAWSPERGTAALTRKSSQGRSGRESSMARGVMSIGNTRRWMFRSAARFEPLQSTQARRSSHPHSPPTPYPTSLRTTPQPIAPPPPSASATASETPPAAAPPACRARTPRSPPPVCRRH